MLMSVNVDFREVYNCIGSDLVMFIAAMVGWAVLHQVKTKGHQMKTPKMLDFTQVESSCEKIVVDTDPEYTIETQIPQPSAIEVKPPQVEPPLAPVEEKFDASKQLALMQKYAAARNIKDTLGTFRSIEANGAALSTPMYNAVMKAWVRCGNIWAAENWMDEVKEAGMADESSFIILIKALLMIQDPEKAKGLLQEMQEAGVQPSIASFDELLNGFVRGGCFNDGISLLEEMDVAEVKPTEFTLKVIADLMNSARRVNRKMPSLRKIFEKYGLGSSQLPRLAAVISQETVTMPYVHEVEIKGSMTHVKALRRTLKLHGFFDQDDTCALEEDSQAEEGVNDQATLSEQSMTPILRDTMQDQAFSAKTGAVLNCVSKQGLCMPAVLENSLMQYLGNDLYFLHVHFESKSSRADIFDAISCQHPRVGIRHCWAMPSMGSCGQRTLVNGVEEDEANFNRHIGAVRSM